MKEKISVSIIIPIYNTAHYLEQCIRSVVSQTWQNIEILLLDDGSTDESPDICMRWANMDGRIRFFAEGHLGQGMQRNIGIKESKGDYIMFLDSDDYLELDAVETVVTYIMKKKAQICFFSYWNERVELEGGKSTYRGNNPIGFQGCASVQELPEMLGSYSALLWDKCYEGDFLRNCGLTMSNLMCEDLLFLGQLLEKACCICTLNAYPYHYRSAREGNFSKNYNRFYDVIEVISRLNRYYEDIGKWDLYWKQLYQISNTASKDIIDRARLRGQIGNNEENEHFIQELKGCIQSWYGSRIDVELDDNRVIVMGSVTAKDIVLSACLDAPAWFRDHTGNSILRMTEYMEQEPFGVDYVIVDFLEEIFPEASFDIDNLNLGQRLVQAFSKIKTLNADSDIRLVIIKNYYCETYGDCWNDVNAYMDIDRIRKVNHKLDVLYEYVREQLPEAIFVETDSCAKWRYSDSRQWGGSVPKVYNQVYIGAVSTEMSVRLYQAYGMTGKGIKERIMHTQPALSDERFIKGFPLLAFFYQRTGGKAKKLLYFADNALKRIAIYGMGNLGKALRKEAEYAGIEVVYAIDRENKEIDGLSVFHIEEGQFPDADVIVVTPVQDYWDIVRRLEEKTGIPIVSLEDVVAYEQK